MQPMFVNGNWVESASGETKYGGPFGGMKMSGNARELGEEGLESFLETKHVH